MKELDKAYNPKETENKIYALWEKAEAFKPVVDEAQKPFVMAIPPPNVTGSLHMGHTISNTIQDILIRRSRMRGVPTLWVPGTDHAGIATQTVVEKHLAKSGINKNDLGREKFLTEVEDWVEKYGHTIIDQLKAMGCSCDWSRQRYTMDEGYVNAVNTAFKHYYDKGWIYQGERVINWCTRCQTSLSDLEVEHSDQNAKLYFFKYDQDFPITIATTRPETKLGDTGVAVNPKDKRYAEYIGQTFKVNFCGARRQIKVFSDPAIDMTFGTGAVGVTPAHSLVDAEMAERNELESIKVIDQYGKMTKEAGPDFEGLKVSEAQAKILEILEKNGLMEKTEDIQNAVSVCYRCARPIEPQPSKQWFLKMKELAKPAIEAVKNGQISFVPERWNKVYLDWMENLRDWCISRQIWWGHRLPVWETKDSYPLSDVSCPKNPENGKRKTENATVYVGSNPPVGYEQSSDVLDTWFSSALWPFATLGWPEKTKDLAYFYPTTTLATARDIIYLWVSRMIFSGYEFMGEKTFSKVYIHPTIFNKEGKRMSKSLGTGIDPLDLIEKYGADATRFGLTYINTGIQDLKFDEEAIGAGKKFANKLWNINRFVCQQIEITNYKLQITNKIPNAKTENDKKILDKLNQTIKSTDSNLDEFKFGQAAHDLYDFVWHDLADIYIEESKKDSNIPVLIYVLTTVLKLLHPIMPFVTEEIWQNLRENKLVEEELLIKAKWPK
jgi:valyl-tRNA synthetase